MLEKLLKIIFPEKCIICKKDHQYICDSCFKQIPYKINYKDNIYYLYDFKNRIVNNLIWKLKYHHIGSISSNFGKVIEKEMENIIIRNCKKDRTDFNKIFILPIPLSSNDKRIFNHNELYLKCLNNFTILNNQFIKNNTIKQAHLKTRIERIKNMENKIVYIGNTNFDENDLIIIFDDVFTTGTTLYEAKKSLLEKSNLKENQILLFTLSH